MTEENEIIRHRREKLAVLRAVGGSFPNDFRRTAMAAELQARYGDMQKEELQSLGIEVAIAGRVMLRRVMGKASFFTVQDGSGRIQCYVRREEIGEQAYEAFNDLWDIGDIVGVSGTLFRTNKGELTVEGRRLRLLAKSLHPLPEKFHGLTDQETRYRQRYLDLMMNDDSRRLFETRSAVIQAIREFFVARGFLEVETPMMQAIAGGAAARPFATHHHALDLPLYLRIAPELYLKRLVVGGFERVFEINRNFRNEGLSPRHNPEFTMLEFYQAYSDYNDLMDLTEELLRDVARQALGTTQINYQGQAIDLAVRFERLTMASAITRYVGLDEDTVRDTEALQKFLASIKHETDAAWGLGRLQAEIFEQRVEEKLMQPVFITEYPAEISPLARRNDANPLVTDRFELFITGREIANGFSELNDPEDQAERFRLQMELKRAGDEDAMEFDEDYITALEYGLPPTAGEGIGIDRLVMLLTNSTSIRDVLLFPHMRPRDQKK
jgi:lysyl-tRNA synthetase, class II